MNKKDVVLYRKMLLDMKQEILKDMQINQEAGQQAHQNEVQDLADQAADAYDRELASTLGEVERARLESIDEALERVDKGLYGICDSCQKNITIARLRALPFARLCVECQTNAEHVAE